VKFFLQKGQKAKKDGRARRWRFCMEPPIFDLVSYKEPPKLDRD
jgi:hypothetical protein